MQINPSTPIDTLLNQLNITKEDFEEVKGFLCFNLIDTKEKLFKFLFNKDNIPAKISKIRSKYKRI